MSEISVDAVPVLDSDVQSHVRALPFYVDLEEAIESAFDEAEDSGDVVLAVFDIIRDACLMMQSQNRLIEQLQANGADIAIVRAANHSGWQHPNDVKQDEGD